MSTSDVELKISANASELTAAMRQAANAVRDSAEQMKSHMGGITGAVEGLRGKFIALGAILAGGAIFRGVIDETIKWTSDAVLLSKTLGITTEKASTLNVALDDLNATSLGFNVSTETMTGALSKLTLRMSKHEQSFADAGVAIRDQNGHLRNSLDIMLDVNTYLSSLKGGTDRNTEAARLYGRSWIEVQGILGLTKERMEEARERAEKLHLLVGPDGVAKTQQYKSALNDVRDQMKGVNVTIGAQLMPTLTKLGSFMGEQGPEMARVLSTALKVVGFVAGSVWLALKDMGDAIGALAAQAVALAHGDLAAMRAIGAERDAQAKKNEEQYEKLKSGIFSEDPAPKKSVSSGGAGADAPAHEDQNKSQKKSRMSTWESELEERKLKLSEEAQAEGRFYEMSKAEEQKYWQAKLALTAKGSEENIAVRKKVATDGQAILKQEFDATVESLRAQEKEYQHNLDAKMELAKRESELVKQKYGEQSKEFQTAQAHIIEIKRAGVEEMRRLADTERENNSKMLLAQVSDDEVAARLKFDMHQVNNEEMLKLESTFEDRRYEINRKALDEKLKLAEKDPDRNPELMAQLHLQLEDLQRQHALKMKQIQSQQMLEVNKAQRTISNTMESSFEASLTAMLTRAQTFRQTLSNIWKNLFTVFMQEMVTKPLAQTIMRVVRESALFKGLFAQQIAGQQAASGTIIGTKVAEATGVVGANAAEAASGAAASVASVPYVGWALAIAAFAGVMSMVMGAKSSISSAEGGYDIPGGVNPLTQLHEREMVLPAGLADNVRNATSVGGGTVIYNDHSGRLSAAELRRNAGVIVDIIKGKHRDFAT